MRPVAYIVSAAVAAGIVVSTLQACSEETSADATSTTDVTSGDAGVGTPLPTVPRTGSVIKFHNNSSRDGFYVDPAFTQAAAGTLHKDTSFVGTVNGNVYAQPLYVEDGPNHQEAFVVATETNHVTVLNSGGTPVWDKTFGPPATSNLPCGNISPLGITGTPVIDPAARVIYFDGMTSADNNQTFKHLIHAVSLDDGTEKTGWPVSFEDIVPGSDAAHHNQRGALDLVNGVLYVPYGGHFGDCDPYHGTVIGVPVANPAQAKFWQTPAQQGGIWSTGGTASDGASIFAATGNTEGASSWAGGEALLRLRPGPSFSSQPVDFIAPTDWQDLDDSDEDLGGANPVLLDMPGAPVPHLILGFGKDANLYIANRDNMGGVGGALTVTKAASGAILGAGAAYTTAQGTYVALRAAYGHGVNCPTGTGTGNIAVMKISADNPPRATTAWCTNEKLGAPIATTDGAGKVVLWDAADKLYGYDGDTGAKIFAGGAASDALGGTMQYFNTPIAVKGRIAVATSGKLTLFKP